MRKGSTVAIKMTEIIIEENVAQLSASNVGARRQTCISWI